jgi:flagellar protein FliJ
MRYTFSLQALLNWKRSLEEYSQLKLAEMAARLKAQEEEIEKLTLKRLGYEQKLKEKAGLGILAGEFALYRQFGEESRKEIFSQEERKRNILQEIDRERGKLLALAKEKKILERLKEKQFQKFRYETDRADQKAIDEITILKYQPETKRKNSF